MTSIPNDIFRQILSFQYHDGKRTMDDMYDTNKYADLTRYPKIFKNCYWGNFTFTKNTNTTLTPTIIENRNRFVEEFSVRREKDLPQRIIKQIGFKDYLARQDGLDHIEYYYTTTKQHIIVTSPYAIKLKDEILEKYQLTLYKKLYAADAVTYIRIISV